MWWLAMLGCSESRISADDPDVIVDPPAEFALRYEATVWPGKPAEPDGSVRAHPVRLPDLNLEQRIDIDFRRPVRVEGLITGLNATPRPRASLPGVQGPVQATVAFRGEEVLQDHVVHTDEEGLFVAWVAPTADEVSIVPDSALIPPLQFAYDAGAERLDVDLAQHVPIWGQITQDSIPRGNVSLQLLFADGQVGPIVRTDADGWYELRATEGMVVAVQSLGFANGSDPVLTGPSAPIGALGLRQDFAYIEQPLHTVAARIVDDDGVSLSAVPYRVRSTSLQAYPDGQAEITGFTDTTGNLTSRLLPGTYTVSVLSEGDVERTSYAVEIDVVGDVDLGEIAMRDFITIAGQVATHEGQLVADTTITCTELGFTGRTWTAATDQNGRWHMLIARSPASCYAAPGDRDLAAARTTVDPNVSTQVDLVLVPGQLLTGNITFEGVPEEFALVEVFDQTGLVWGTALADPDGTFAVRIQGIRSE